MLSLLYPKVNLYSTYRKPIRNLLVNLSPNNHISQTFPKLSGDFRLCRIWSSVLCGI